MDLKGDSGQSLLWEGVVVLKKKQGQTFFFLKGFGYLKMTNFEQHLLGRVWLS